MLSDIQVIAFDADDTLWVNEPYFREAEDAFCDLLENFMPRHALEKELMTREVANLPLYGYGIKAFMLSMIETAMAVTNHAISAADLARIMHIGRDMLAKPVELLPGVEKTLQALQKKYRLVVATKGDLLDQERKLQLSGLSSYFHHIEIVSEKKEAEYQKLIKHLDVLPEQFLMVGNSLKSDILPVLQIGGHGFHIPFYITWEHEKVDIQIENPRFKQLQTLEEMLTIL